MEKGGSAVCPVCSPNFTRSVCIGIKADSQEAIRIVGAPAAPEMNPPPLARQSFKPASVLNPQKNQDAFGAFSTIKIHEHGEAPESLFVEFFECGAS